MTSTTKGKVSHIRFNLRTIHSCCKLRRAKNVNSQNAGLFYCTKSWGQPRTGNGSATCSKNSTMELLCQKRTGEFPLYSSINSLDHKRKTTTIAIKHHIRRCHQSLSSPQLTLPFCILYQAHNSQGYIPNRFNAFERVHLAGPYWQNASKLLCPSVF